MIIQMKTTHLELWTRRGSANMREPEAATTGESLSPEVEGRGSGVAHARKESVTESQSEAHRLSGTGSAARGLAIKTLAVLIVALAALIPTVGDFGLTWDEPAYRYSQVMSAQWWEQLGQARSLGDLRNLFDPLTLLYYWPYGRYGINFHPPLAGQLNLATTSIFGHWMKDIPARRMATVIEFALTITIGFHFLARRYGVWVGIGHGRIAAVDAAPLWPGSSDRHRYSGPVAVGGDGPGILEWAARAACAAMADRRRHPAGPGVRRKARRRGGARAACALADRRAPSAQPSGGPGRRFDWIDGILTTGAMLAPLALAFQQIQILQQRFPPPMSTDLFVDRPTSDWPGAILAVPLCVWLLRRLLGRLFPKESRCGEPSGRHSRPGRPSWPSPRSSAGWATRPGGVRRCRGWPTITRSATSGAARFPTSRSSISARSTNTVFPGIMPGY